MLSKKLNFFLLKLLSAIFENSTWSIYRPFKNASSSFFFKNDEIFITSNRCDLPFRIKNRYEFHIIIEYKLFQDHRFWLIRLDQYGMIFFYKNSNFIHNLTIIKRFHHFKNNGFYQLDDFQTIWIQKFRRLSDFKIIFK